MAKDALVGLIATATGGGDCEDLVLAVQPQTKQAKITSARNSKQAL